MWPNSVLFSDKLRADRILEKVFTNLLRIFVFCLEMYNIIIITKLQFYLHKKQHNGTNTVFKYQTIDVQIV